MRLTVSAAPSLAAPSLAAPSLAAPSLAALSLATLAILACGAPPARAQVMTRAALEQRAAALRAQWASHPHRGDPTEPSLIGGSILTPHVNVAVAPGAPRIRLVIDPGTVGLSGFDIQMIAPNGLQGASVSGGRPSYLPMNKPETLTIQVSSAFANQGFGFYTKPGAWTVNEVALFSTDGSFITYSGSQLAAIFPSIVVHVQNPGTPDVTPPVIGTGVVVTPTIKLSDPAPYFEARLMVTDDNSGVANVAMSFTAPNGAFGYGAYSTIFSPKTQGKVVVSSPFQPSDPTGTYTINYLSVCDVAGNCASESTPSSIQATLGTTTFVVTN